MSRALREAPPPVLYLGLFSKHERKIIAANANLRVAIGKDAPILWRPVYEAHQVKRRPVFGAAPRRLGG